jgi:hypothetical protein
MHTIVLVALILLIFGFGPWAYPGTRATYGGYGFYGVVLTLIVLGVLFLNGCLVLR